MFQDSPSNSAGPTPTMMIDMGRQDACRRANIHIKRGQNKTVAPQVKGCVHEPLSEALGAVRVLPTRTARGEHVQMFV